MKNYYQILGVSESADDQQIKDAYRKLAKRYHPDVNAGAKGAEEKFKEIAEAYDTLSDPVLRSNYDRKRTKQYYYSFDFNIAGTEERKDPRKKEYTDAEFAYAREKHQRRTEAHMQRRKRILVGMIVTFVIFLFAAVQFENYIEKQRKLQADAMKAAMNAPAITPTAPKAKPVIEDLDSPYDTLFGVGVYTRFSPNEISVYNPFSDAIITLQMTSPPYTTIRNEFITAKHAFRFAELPNGTFRMKIYSGTHWDPKLKLPNGQQLGGFTQQVAYYEVDDQTFSLQKPTFDHPNTNTSDTISIDPVKKNYKVITAEEFFSSSK